MTECEKLKIGEEFLTSQEWPDIFRKTEFDRCYCSTCYPTSKRNTYVVGGYTYVIARGWTRFGIHVHEPFTKLHNVWQEWANCYHGTSIKNAKSIVEHGQLLLPGDKTLHGKELEIPEGHIPDQYYIFTTPTIKYASLDSYTSTYNFQSSITQKDYKIKVVLQCKQKPDSFTVQPETVRARQKNIRICPIISNDEIEWKTQHRSATMPYSLMLEIIHTDPNKIDNNENNNNYQEVKCPNCSGINLWSNGGYNEGTAVTCVYETCKKKFQQISCPNCFGSKFWKNADYRSGIITTCIYENCKKPFQQINCPHCSGSIVWKNANYTQGTATTCTYEKCKKKFQQINCPHCSRSMFWKNTEYKPGTITTCPYENCKKIFQQINCPHCSGSMSWKNADHKPEFITTCPHENCKKTFRQI